MYIDVVPNRTSPPAVLLRESYRDGNKIKKRTLLNLTGWPRDLVEGFRALLKGGTVIPAGQDALSITRSLPHGHVAAVLGKQTTGRTEDGLPVHSFQSLLADLATLTRNTVVTALTPDHPFTLTARPTTIQRKALDLLGVAVNCTQ